MRAVTSGASHLTTTTIRHWLPLITFCPVNGLPDVIYVSIEFDDFIELYAVRKQIRKTVMWKKMFMEDIAKMLVEQFPDALSVQVRLAFDRHVVIMDKFH